MKIRIKGNTLRLRLSQTEVHQLESNCSISDAIQFPGRKLSYTLSRSDVEEVTAVFSDDQIHVKVPEETIESWVGSNQVGFDFNQNIGKGQTLYILVEKDFKCSIDRGEDESDLFDPL